MAGNVNTNVSSSMYCRACGAANPVQATHCLACLEPLSITAGVTSATTHPLTGLLLPEVIIQRRYCILDVLNAGRVSTMYRAEDMQLGNRMVSLKEIGKNNQNTQDALASINADKREMLLLASLIHPNLPRIYDYFVENHRWYFVMDFLEGETLEAYQSKRKYRPLPVEEVLDCGLQLSAVLDFLHIHQPSLDLNNLTLRNIWRTPDGKLYLLDTGTSFSSHVMLASSSIYSLGKILRQLQAGKMSALSRLYFALSHLRRRHRHPQSWQLQALIRQMAHRNVNKRPSIMGIVRQELQQLTAQHSPHQQSAFSRRTLLKMAGYSGLVVATSTLTWLVESSVLRGVHPDYSPNLGGTISTYYTDSGVLGVSWSSNGLRLVMGNWQGHVQAFDANTGLNSISFQAPELSNRVEDVKWLPGGNAIAAAGDDSIVWIWNAATGELLHTYRGHTYWVISLACSPDGKYIASGSYDKTVQVWEVATGRQVVIYNGHSDRICAVAWSPDGSYIASASYDTTVQIWEAATGQPVYTYGNHGYPVYTVAWSPDGQRIASGDSHGVVKVWPITLFEGNELKQETPVSFSQHPGTNSSIQNNAVQAVAWSPDSRFLATVGHDVQIFNSFTGKPFYTYTKHTGLGTAVQAVAWSPNGMYIASGGMEATVQVWNAKL